MIDVSAVAIMPGDTQLARMVGAYSRAVVRVRLTTAALAALYGASPCSGRLALRLATVTTLPPPPSRSSGIAARSVWKVPSRFTPTTRRHSSSVCLWSGLLSPIPALAITSVSPPMATARVARPRRWWRRDRRRRPRTRAPRPPPRPRAPRRRRGRARPPRRLARPAAGGGGADARAASGDDRSVAGEVLLGHRGVSRERCRADAGDDRRAAAHDRAPPPRGAAIASTTPSSTTVSSRRASAAPRQKWGPCPRATWWFGVRPTSKVLGGGAELGLVAVGRRVEQQQWIACGDGHARRARCRRPRCA